MRGDGSLYQRGDVFWVSYYHDGKTHRESTGKTDETEANKYLKNLRDELGAARIGARTFTSAKSSRLRVRELVEALKADFQLRNKLSAQNASHLKRVTADFGQYRASELTAEKIDAYVEARLADKTGPKGEPIAGDKNSSVNRTTQILSQAFTLAIRRGTLSRAPYVRRLPEDNVREGFFDEAQARAVLANLPNDGLRDFVLFAYLCGWRKGSIAKLRWDAVDLEAGEILLPGKYVKNRKPLKMAIEGELKELLDRRKAARSFEVNGVAQISEFVFHRGDGRAVCEFRKSWRTACRLAECPGKLLHDFRRTAARDLIRSGCDESVAMKITGHVTNSVFKRYNISDDDDLREGLRGVAKYRRTQAAKKVVAISR
jgi:integrase